MLLKGFSGMCLAMTSDHENISSESASEAQSIVFRESTTALGVTFPTATNEDLLASNILEK